MKNRTEASYLVSQMLLDIGFEHNFAVIIGNEMNTDFTANMMIGYLRDAQPHTMEEVADEMLGILEFRQKCAERQIAKKRYFNAFDV